MKTILVLPFVLITHLLLLSPSFGQMKDVPTERVFPPPTTLSWLGSYGSVQLSDKLFWLGEFHLRTSEYDGTPFIGRMAQVYNRHGIQYLFSKSFSATLGGVLRLDFTPEPGNDDFRAIVLEPRIWHQYIFALPFYRGSMVYHRFRFEHRWSRSAAIGAKRIFRNRWRYKFNMKIPLNTTRLTTQTWYFNPDIELIMQSGDTIVTNPFENLRIYPALGYIHTPRVKFSTGFMWTLGQIDPGFIYNQRWIYRFNVYLTLDFRKLKDRIPKIKFDD